MAWLVEIGSYTTEVYCTCDRCNVAIGLRVSWRLLDEHLTALKVIIAQSAKRFGWLLQNQELCPRCVPLMASEDPEFAAHLMWLDYRRMPDFPLQPPRRAVPELRGPASGQAPDSTNRFSLLELDEPEPVAPEGETP